MIKYILENYSRFINLLTQHLQITITALTISLLLGLILGFLVYDRPRASLFLNSFVGGLRVIPSLVVLLVLLPILGTGRLPAIIALIIIGLPNILGRTIQGLLDVSADVLEVAHACGMTNWQMFWQVRLPLALPTLITGARMSSLSVAAGATLAAYIGAGGLGELILSGISQYRGDILLAGAVPIVLISIMLEILFQLIYLLATPYKRKENT